MRFAFISDIHGNLPSLELVLDDIRKTNVDQIICLGDVASLGPQPREAVARLRELQIPVVMGNHDNYLLNLHLTENHIPWLRAAEFWSQSQLSEDDLNYLRTFRPRLDLTPAANTRILAFHGSPRSNEEFLYPDTPPALFDELFNGHEARLYVGGHTHVQMVRQHRGVTILNPGSVGMPFEFPMPGQDQRAIRRAEYALVDVNDGRLDIDLRQLPIDFEQMIRIARASGLPDTDFWISTWEK